MLNRKKISIVLFSIVLLLTACVEQDVEKEETDKKIVVPQVTLPKTAEVEMGDLVTEIEGKTTIVYPDTVNLSWDYDDTYYKEVYVKAGQKVKKGETLISFDVEASTAELENQKLKLTRQKENVQKEKEQMLLEIDLIQETLPQLSSHELTLARLNIEKLKVLYDQYVYQSNKEIDEQQQIVSELEKKINHNCLVAPFDGIISKVSSYKIGNKVSKGSTLIVMYSTENFYMEVTNHLDQFQYNMTVSLEVISEGVATTVRGKVLAAQNILPENISSKNVIIGVDKGVISDLSQVSSVTYTCETQKIRNVILADKNVVHTEWGETFVYLYEDNIIKKRIVVPGYSNADKIWITDGLSSGQTLILE